MHELNSFRMSNDFFPMITGFRRICFFLPAVSLLTNPAFICLELLIFCGDFSAQHKLQLVTCEYGDRQIIETNKIK